MLLGMRQGVCEFVQVKGQAAVVGVLLDARADADARTLKGNTPLLFAANAGNCECARLLITRGASVNAQNRSDGDTSLHRSGPLASAGCAPLRAGSSRLLPRPRR